MEIECCSYCGNPTLQFKETPETIHYGRIDCTNCGRWIKWVMNPKFKGQRRQTSKYDIKEIMDFHKYAREPFCFFCLRTQKQLGEHETLTRDHIQELDKGGQDILQNLQILCFACHKLKNWSRLYLNWHFNERGK